MGKQSMLWFVWVEKMGVALNFIFMIEIGTLYHLKKKTILI